MPRYCAQKVFLEWCIHGPEGYLCPSSLSFPMSCRLSHKITILHLPDELKSADNMHFLPCGMYGYNQPLCSMVNFEGTQTDLNFYHNYQTGHLFGKFTQSSRLFDTFIKTIQKSGQTSFENHMEHEQYSRWYFSISLPGPYWYTSAAGIDRALYIYVKS